MTKSDDIYKPTDHYWKAMEIDIDICEEIAKTLTGQDDNGNFTRPGQNVAVVTVGISGSGKTTLANEVASGAGFAATQIASESNYGGPQILGSFIRLSRDSVRDALSNGEYSGDNIWDWSREEEVTEYIDDALDYLSETDQPKHLVLFDDTNLNSRFFPQMIDKLHGLGYKIFEKKLHTPVDVCVKRIVDRYHETGRAVPMKVLASQIKMFYGNETANEILAEPEIVELMTWADKEMEINNG